MKQAVNTPSNRMNRHNAETKHNAKILRVFKKIGFVDAIKISDTLQGSIWRASESQNSNTFELKKTKTAVIKVTNILLQKQSISIIGNKTYSVAENILSEQSILKHLTECKNLPKSIIKFYRFCRSNNDYFLVMEDGGIPLFSFIQKAHQLIKKGEIDINHWRKVVKIIFNQMIECIEFIHSKNVCHFDISLENFLINDVCIEVRKIGNIQNKITKNNVSFVTDDIQIKLCDFGLAELFTKSECHSNKYCGKPNYKSPEIINKKKQFDAKKNDIWMLGVCLFMMMIGHPPWNEAHETDPCFMYIMNGYIMDVLKGWNCLNYVDEHIIHLFQSIFQDEANRFDLDQIKKHWWMK